MPLLRKISLSLLLGLAFAFGFNSLFLDWLDRPAADQILLIFFSTAAAGYLVFSLLGPRQEIWDRLRIQAPPAQGAALASFLSEHAAGLTLALVFFALYTLLGLRLNNPYMDTVDNFLDADNSSWMARIAFPAGASMELRGPHPYAYFILRPLGWGLNLLTQNPGLSAILLNAFAGGLCVFLAWALIKDQVKNRVYALLIACLLGLSTAHLFFGSVIESYIFSAAALIGFVFMLQKQRGSIGPLVGLGLITFGITLTNFVQNLIGFLVSRPRLKEIIRFSGLTISIGILLGLFHAVWFPSSKLFFLPSSAQAEEQFASSIFQEPSWKAIGRVILVVRTMALYTVVAPRPYVFLQDVGDSFPRFNFFKVVPGTYSYSSYNGLGTVLVLAWLALLLAAGVLFLRTSLRTRKADLPLALIGCILFNFLLHLNYGYEPFLYSPDWAYALILFVGLSLAPLANSRIFQGSLLAFLLLLAWNQYQFFQFIFQTIAPFLGLGA